MKTNPDDLKIIPLKEVNRNFFSRNPSSDLVVTLKESKDHSFRAGNIAFLNSNYKVFTTPYYRGTASPLVHPEVMISVEWDRKQLDKRGSILKQMDGGYSSKHFGLVLGYNKEDLELPQDFEALKQVISSKVKLAGISELLKF